MTEAAKSTIDQAEVDRFSAMAAEWWDPSGKFKPLHKFSTFALAGLGFQVAVDSDANARQQRFGGSDATRLDGAPVTCPDCGAALQAAGSHPRTLRTEHDRPVVLDRTYARCPVCGTGLFPPG
mgnify:CR=1 FL=1